MKYECFIKQIEKYCYENKISHSQFSKDIGRHRSYIYQLINGKVDLSLETFILIINKIGSSPTLALSDKLTIDRYKIIVEAYSELKHLESLNQVDQHDLELAISILEVFKNKATKKSGSN